MTSRPRYMQKSPTRLPAAALCFALLFFAVIAQSPEASAQRMDPPPPIAPGPPAQQADPSPAAQVTTTTTTEEGTAHQLQEIRDALSGQQRQIQQLEQQVTERDRHVRELEQRTVSAASVPPRPAVEGRDQVPEMKNPVSLTEVTVLGVTLKAGGFTAAETVYRSHSQQNDMISTFSGIAYNGDPRTRLTEFRGSARQSRLSLLAEGNTGRVKLSGYWEMDFLGAVPNSNENQASGFTPRVRQLFAQVALDSGWSVSAGQTWSLITMNKKGISTRSEWSPATIEAQYVVGYDFARLYTARLTKSFGHDKVTIALAAETPAFLVGGAVPKNVTGVPGGVLSAGIGSLGNGVNYSTGMAPDVLAKLAVDPGWGHYEVKGMTRLFRDHVLDTGQDHYKTGGGVGGGAIIPLVSTKLDVVAQGLYGYGIARYQDSGTADIVVRPNGGLSLVRAGSFTGGIETRPTSTLDLYLYGGIEYQGRTAGAQNGTSYGYGSPSANLSGCYAQGTSFSCSADYRDLDQVATGLWYRPLKGAFGMIQAGIQYSYTVKHAWSGLNGSDATSSRVAPKATEHMAYTSLRYYIP